MSKFGCPAKFIAVVRQYHDRMNARVRDENEYPQPYSVNNGVKQGCVLAPTVFSMVSSAMLTDDFPDGDLCLRLGTILTVNSSTREIASKDKCE